MGGDRDGNPFVTPETTRDVVIGARLRCAGAGGRLQGVQQQAVVCIWPATWIACVHMSGCCLLLDCRFPLLTQPHAMRSLLCSAVTLLTEQVERLMYELSMWRASPELKARAGWGWGGGGGIHIPAQLQAAAWVLHNQRFVHPTRLSGAPLVRRSARPRCRRGRRRARRASSWRPRRTREALHTFELGGRAAG